MPNTLTGDIDVVQPSASEMITQPDTFATSRLTSGWFDRGDEVGVAQDVERLLQRLEVVGTDEDEGGGPLRVTRMRSWSCSTRSASSDMCDLASENGTVSFTGQNSDLSDPTARPEAGPAVGASILGGSWTGPRVASAAPSADHAGPSFLPQRGP